MLQLQVNGQVRQIGQDVDPKRLCSGYCAIIWALMARSMAAALASAAPARCM